MDTRSTAQQGRISRYFRGRTFAPKLVVTLSTIALLAGFLITVLWLVPHRQRIDNGTYQVVYLAGGQAYFGNLKNTSGDYLVLEDPYTAQDTQASSSGSGNLEASTQTTLVKVSAQVYGPDESIALRSDQVLFWQNLRSDSKVVEAIKAKQ